MSIADILETMEYGPAPEAVDPALHWIEEHEGSFGVYVGGRWSMPESGEQVDIVNPATGRPIASVSQSGAVEVDAAVAAARAAFPAWRETSGHARARYLYAIARQLQRHSRLFAVLESLDNGKPIRESRDIDIPL